MVGDREDEEGMKRFAWLAGSSIVRSSPRSKRWKAKYSTDEVPKRAKGPRMKGADVLSIL